MFPGWGYGRDQEGHTGTRTFSKAPNPKSASWSHLGTRNCPPCPPWLGTESLHESSASLFRWTRSVVTSYTLTQRVRASARTALQRDAHGSEAGPTVTTSSAEDPLCASFPELGSLRLQNEDPSFFTDCKPHQRSLALKRTRTRKTENLTQRRTEGKEPVSGSQLYSTLDLPDFFQCVRAQSTGV